LQLRQLENPVRRIDYAEIATWCEASGYELRDWIPALSSSARSLEFSPSAFHVQQLPEFLDALVSLGPDERLVWLRDWTIWNDRSQDIGLRHLGLLTGAASLSEADDSRAQAFLLTPAEWREAIALLTIPILYGWDAHLFFKSALVLVDVSHHGTVRVVFRDDERLIGRLATWLKKDDQRPPRS
jgi:hypothetical protein